MGQGMDREAVSLLSEPLNARAAIATPPNTMPTIGPGLWYQGTAAFFFFFSSSVEAVAVSGTGLFVNRTFSRVVPAASTLTGATS